MSHFILNRPKLCFLFLLVVSSSILTAQIVDIPDPIFKNVLVNELCVDITNDGMGDASVDLNVDGEIQVAEALLVRHLLIDSQGINSIEGIQAFTNLETLSCFDNNVTDVDLSGLSNLKFASLSTNQIETIDLSENISLETLGISSNNIEQIDITNLPNLRVLAIGFNQINTIDLSKNFALENLWIVHNNLVTLDVSNNNMLVNLDAVDNNLTTLDISNNSMLRGLDIGRNIFTTIDVSKNLNLLSLIINDNPIESVDITNNLNLSRFSCSGTLLSGVLDLSNYSNFEQLIVENTMLDAVNLRNGNNENLFVLRATMSDNLSCIQLDTVDLDFTVFPFNQWEKDDHTMYSENCELSVTDILPLTYTLYPNPATTILNIAGELPVESTAIYNSLGAQVQTNNTGEKQIDITQLSEGLYFLRIQTMQGVTTQKFIKED